MPDLRETAIQALLDGYIANHSGADPDREAIQRHINNARKADVPAADLTRTAEQRFAKWLTNRQ